MKVAGTQRRVLYISLLIVFSIIGVYLASFLPSADWLLVFDKVPRAVLHGESPYSIRPFVNPPWTVLLLMPFSLLTPELGRGAAFVLCALALIYVAWRLHARPLAIAALLLSPTVIGALIAGTFDAFLLPALFLPPVWALFFLLIKPQIGMGVAIFYFVQAWRKKGILEVFRTFAPVTAAYIVSALLFPVWVNRLLHMTSDPWNRSLFPYAIPLGLFFLWLAIRRDNVFFALAATPFFSPYLTFYSYLIVQVALLHEDVEKVVRRDVLQIILAVFLWTIMLVFKL